MKPSPTWSKILAAYAVLFAGLAPAVLAGIALWHGVGLSLVYNALLGGMIVYFGIRVFLGDPRAVTMFAVLVVFHYFGVTLSNVLNYDSYPEGSRAQQMAVPRAVRGVLFGAVYAWYYLMRKRTRYGFTSRKLAAEDLNPQTD